MNKKGTAGAMPFPCVLAAAATASAGSGAFAVAVTATAAVRVERAVAAWRARRGIAVVRTAAEHGLAAEVDATL